MEITFFPATHSEDSYFFFFFHELVRQMWPQEDTEEGSENKAYYIHRSLKWKAQHTTQEHMGKTPGWSGSRRQK